MSEINEESRQPTSETNQPKRSSAPGPTEEVRKLIVVDVPTEAVQADDDRSPGLDRHETTAKLPITPSADAETIRELIVPGAADAAQSDDDRSPGLDRHETTAKLPITPSTETEVIRKPIVPEATKPQSDSDN